MNKSVKEFLEFAWSQRRLVILPVAVCGALSLVYALFKPSYWNATQALYVRDESTGAVERGGRFESVDAMQTAQETILEVARHPEVLRAALEEVGPRRRLWGSWPSAEDIEDFRDNVSISAPNGAQFGRTEMIYVTVTARTTERATQLTSAVVSKLIDRMQLLRVHRYGSIVGELEQAVAVGRDQLARSTARLQAIEKEIGMDLAELRVLMDQGQGDGNVRRALSQIETELRVAKANLARKQNAYEQLTMAVDDPRRLINMPSEILDAQPSLKNLKEGLASAQLRVSQIMGVKSARHPDVQAAIQAEERTRLQLYRVLRASIATLKNDVGVAQKRVAQLEKQFDLASGRMGGLANIRTRYSNLSNEVRQRSEYLEQAQSDLSQAQTNLLAARNVSLIQTVEAPVPGTRPIGIGRTSIVLVGCFGGLFIGGGLLVLVMPIRETSPAGERRHTNWGRRASDRLRHVLGRRATDSAPPGAPIATPDSPGLPTRRATDGWARRSTDVSSSTTAPERGAAASEPRPERRTPAPIAPLDTQDWGEQAAADRV